MDKIIQSIIRHIEDSPNTIKAPSIRYWFYCSFVLWSYFSDNVLKVDEQESSIVEWARIERLALTFGIPLSVKRYLFGKNNILRVW